MRSRLLQQVWTLTVKNLLITLIRPSFTTVLRAFVLPVVFVAIISYARNFFVPPSVYGIGEPSPVRSLKDALSAVGGGRNKVVFVNNGFGGGDIQKVIDQVAAPARQYGDQVVTLSAEEELQQTCRTTLRGTSSCVAAAVFYSSPTEGPDGIWNYSIRADGSLGTKIDTKKNSNDQEIYLLPLQHSIDWAIAQSNGSSSGQGLPRQVDEYPFTSLSQKERQDQIRVRYMSAIIDVISIALFIGMVGVTYQLTGLVAMEREIGMSQLIDCVIATSSHWKAQAVRFIAAHLALDLIYAPGWVVTAIILKFGVFAKTSVGVILINHILVGLALSSFSIFGAAFFRKAQLSGITIVLANLLLGIVAQLGGISSNGAVVVLSLLFPSMNYVFFTIGMARWERQSLPTNIVKAAPESSWTIPGIALWILLIVQIIAYPVLGALVERALYGTTSTKRTTGTLPESLALKLDGFSKDYIPSWFNRRFGSLFGSKRQVVHAVSNLTLDVVKGEIMVLLGANGSGKSTTLDAVSGLTKITSGSIQLDYGENEGKFGLCPQKNVLWSTLTVEEHVKIFNGLKSLHGPDSRHDLRTLIEACDLKNKVEAQSRTLSGGQKRKLQLAMMFTGGSSVCCVDEVSSGLDPISRRKIWDILLAERGRRTIILTTHFLDEAELLADHIAILSRGSLEADGSTVELKTRLGSGYRIHVPHGPSSTTRNERLLEGVQEESHFDETVYMVQDSAQVPHVIAALEHRGVSDYRISGPTIEDVFLKVAREIIEDLAHPVQNISAKPKETESDTVTQAAHGADGPQILKGKRISMPRQAWTMFRKRLVILRRNFIPYLAAFLIPIIASGLVTLFLKNAPEPTCSGPGLFSSPDVNTLSSVDNILFVAGPRDRISTSSIQSFLRSISGFSGIQASSLSSLVHTVDTFDQFNSYINDYRKNVTPGGFWLGDASSNPTFAWKANNGLFPLAAATQNALDNFLIKTPIGFRYQAFDIPWQNGVGNMLQLLTYFGLAYSVYPAMFALYPTVERLRNVRALHYSNGVRKLPLWLAYLCFDFCVVLAVSVLTIVIFRAASDVWYHPEYLFVVFFLYGICSTILAYLISLITKSQLAAFAFVAGMQCVFFLIYFIGYMAVLTYAPTTEIDSYLSIVHFTISIVTPVGSLTRAMFLSLNIFSILCRDRQIVSYPGEITVYGGPILYLIVQSIVLFALLVYLDGGRKSLNIFRSHTKPEDVEEKTQMDEDVVRELARVKESDDGLRVLNLNKSFKKFVAVENISFGVNRGEVFALLGPNGAGKTTTISLIRGDIQPSKNGGEIFVEDVSVTKSLAAARSHLGVCPQFDAMDQMTVIEHLKFYARIRGVPDVDHNVRQVIEAVGLTPFQYRMATKLSGGNKRKLSLGIALMGNPAVLLLDEPSSGMDAASKRVMWKTLASVAPGRSIVLTTHSMEEADALASRAGIMAKRMLALGTTDYLRAKHGNMYHVHLVHTHAPHTSDEEMARIRDWVQKTFPGAVIEQKFYHGQLRFSVPAVSASKSCGSVDSREDGIEPGSATDSSEGHANASPVSQGNGQIGELFRRLEEVKQDLGIMYYSVSQTTLDQVFLKIVGDHQVEEENSRSSTNRRGFSRWRS